MPKQFGEIANVIGKEGNGGQKVAKQPDSTVHNESQELDSVL